jgi:hypothetical protein
MCPCQAIDDLYNPTETASGATVPVEAAGQRGVEVCARGILLDYNDMLPAAVFRIPTQRIPGWKSCNVPSLLRRS